MRVITKGVEPKSLTEHRASTHSCYDNYARKDDLRSSLVTEQGAICCYCMGRIRAEVAAMKIEHWRCQSQFAAHQLDYGNLLGACVGGDGLPWHKQHCDTRKGNADLTWNPAEAAHAIESRVRYDIDGTIGSSDDAFCKQLDDVLNLNLAVLKKNRRVILEAIVMWWKSEKERLKGPVPKTSFEKELSRRLDSGPQLPPYSGVAVWWLQERLARMS